MLRLCVGLVLVGWVAVTQAAQPDEDFAPKFDLLSTRFAHPGTDYFPPYQLSASVVLTRLPDSAPSGLAFGNPSLLHSIGKSQQEGARTINSHWQQTYSGGRLSLPRLLHVEFKVEELNVAFRPHSFSIEGERLKVTFRPRMALIEGARLKILFQPNSASILWGEAF